MRVFSKTKGCVWDPSSSSIVHPSIEDEHWATPRSVNKAKVMELLGVGSPQERQEIYSLLSRVEIPTGSGNDSCDEDEGEFANLKSAVMLPHPRETSTAAQMVTIDESNVGLHKVYMQPPIVETHCLQELATTVWGLKLLKIPCLAGMSLVLSNKNFSGKSSSFQPHTEKVGNKSHNVGARQENIFPLPPPFPEKHLLPSPKRKDGSPVAHPLPQPPLSKSPSNQPSGNQVNERKDCITCLPLSVNDLGTKEAAPLPSIFENAKMAHVSPSETSNQRVPSMTHKLISSLPLARESARPCHLLPSPPIGGSTLNSPSPSAASRQLCLPIGGSTLNSPSPSATSRQLCLPGGGLTTNSPLPSPESKPSCLPAGGPILNSSLSSPASKRLCPRIWRKGAILGQGTFGIVHEGLNLEDSSFFAVKVSSTEDTSLEIQQEVDLLSKLEHPNIVRYLGSSIEDGRLCIFLELVRMGSLATLLQKYKRFEENTIRTYTRQILHGLEYLHAQKTIHRDIKCANILVDVTGQVKLSDFGVAKEVGETLATSSKGTPLYMAPEVLTPKQNCYSFSADIWSLGCTVLEMADGKPPWSNLQGFGFLFKVKNGELPPMPKHLSPEGKDFVCRCLKFHAKDRPTASELLQHPFVSHVSSPELSVPWVPRCTSQPSSSPNSQTCLDQPVRSAAQCTL